MVWFFEFIYFYFVSHDLYKQEGRGPRETRALTEVKAAKAGNEQPKFVNIISGTLMTYGIWLYEFLLYELIVLI